MLFEQAMERAKAYSDQQRCTIFVNGKIKLDPDGRPAVDIHAWEVSEWYREGSTVAKFTDGERNEC